MLKGFRSLFSHSRVPTRLANAPNASVYRVRFVQNPQKRHRGRTATKSLIYSAIAVSLLNVGVVLLVNGEPLFIPLWLPKAGPPEKFTSKDPEPAMYKSFSSNQDRQRKVRRLTADKTKALLQQAFKNKLGPNPKADGAMLFFHFPLAPPPQYIQTGLLIAASDFTAENHIYRSIDISVAKRVLPQRDFLRISHITQPTWMLTSIMQSLRGTIAVLSATAPPEEEVSTLNDAVDFGIGLGAWMWSDLKRNLQRSRKPHPPLRGHITIDGLVQISSDTMVVGVDVTASFHPDQPEQFMFHRARIRFAGRLAKRPPVLAKALEVRNQESLAPQVMQGLKKDMEGVKAVVASIEKEQQREKAREHDKVLAAQDDTGKDKKRAEDMEGLPEKQLSSQKTEPGPTPRRQSPTAAPTQSPTNKP